MKVLMEFNGLAHEEGKAESKKWKDSHFKSKHLFSDRATVMHKQQLVVLKYNNLRYTTFYRLILLHNNKANLKRCIGERRMHESSKQIARGMCLTFSICIHAVDIIFIYSKTFFSEK